MSTDDHGFLKEARRLLQIELAAKSFVLARGEMHGSELGSPEYQALGFVLGIPASHAGDVAPNGLPRYATVDLVSHPNRGECLAVWNNCESFLQTEKGEKIPCKISDGGCDTEGTWRSAEDSEHGRIRLRVVLAGIYHRRARDREWGYGWILSGGTFPWNLHRFMSDDGSYRDLDWVSMTAGTAASVLRQQGHSGAKLSEEESKWVTYFLGNGEVREIRFE